MAYFIWLQFFPISWTNQSTEKDNSLHTFMYSKCIRTNISCRTHPPCFSTVWKGETLYSSISLLYVLLCLYLLPYCLKTEVFLTAGLFSHKVVWFQLAGNYFHPKADLLVRDPQEAAVRSSKASWLTSQRRGESSVLAHPTLVEGHWSHRVGGCWPSFSWHSIRRWPHCRFVRAVTSVTVTE